MPAKRVEMTLPSSTLARVEAGGCLKVWQSAGNDPDVHAIQQSAQAGDEEQE
jgi:hypothetical protein